LEDSEVEEGLEDLHEQDDCHKDFVSEQERPISANKQG
jgi:hypothetical protein